MPTKVYNNAKYIHNIN